MAFIARFFAAFALVLAVAPSHAQSDADIDALFDALAMTDLLAIQRLESIEYGASLGRDELPNGGGKAWQTTIAAINAPEKMGVAMKRGFQTAITATDIPPLIDFFTSDVGRVIIELEVSARRAFLDKDIEQAARSSFRDIEGTDNARLAQVAAYIHLNDLIEYNVVAMANVNYWFYLGLTNGGIIKMTEDEMLAEAWAGEEDLRSDTREWMFAYLLVAFAPLDSAQMQAYVDLSKTPHGRALNRALFAGFETMYKENSYALGLALAQHLAGSDL